MMTRLTVCLLALGLWLPGASQPAAFDTPKPADPFLNMRYELAGESEAAILSEARLRGVREAVGRLYFGEYMLRARGPLLDAFLERNAPSFISSYTVHSIGSHGDAQAGDVEVFVDVSSLYKALYDMKFFYRPAFRPIFYAFVAETFDGQNVEGRYGREALIQAIDARQQRYLWGEGKGNPEIPLSEKREVLLTDPPATSDSSDDLAAACREAQRNEVEVFFTGSIESKTARSEKVYFDAYTFVDTRCVLRLVRADTGEVLAEAETSKTAGNVDAQKALAAAAQAAAADVAPRLLDAYEKQWGKAVLFDKDWGPKQGRRGNLLRIMVLGADEATLDTMRKVLTGMPGSPELYTRSNFAGVAVMALCWDGEADDFIQTLRRTPYPDFAIQRVEPQALEPVGYILTIVQ